jgi:transposase
MLRRQGFPFELLPKGQETRHLQRFAGSCRLVYNKALPINKERYEKKEKRLGYAELCALLPSWKREHPFLSGVPAQAWQQALKNLERACRAALGREGCQITRVAILLSKTIASVYRIKIERGVTLRRCRGGLSK